MEMAVSYTGAPDLSGEDYVAVGLATCFLRVEGEFHEVTVIEPIPVAALEAIIKGIPTSYQWISGVTLGSVLQGETPQRLEGFPDTAQWCDDFVERVIAATRTFKRKPESAALVPVGSQLMELNYSLEKKRILNSTRVIRTEDNVKQHEYTHKVL